MRTKTHREAWQNLLRSLGGRVTSRDLAIAAAEARMFPDLEHRAYIKALQADLRKCLNDFDSDGNPGAIATETYGFDENGEEVKVELWVQLDFCELNEWEVSVRNRSKGIRHDLEKLDKLAKWGIRRWHKKAESCIQEIQLEFGFRLDGEE